mgnify:CR=1 FL=1
MGASSFEERDRAGARNFAAAALAGTLAYELTDRWSIGGGPILLYTDSETRARINNFFGPDGRIKLEEDGIGVSWQLGLMYEPSERTRFGAVYRAETDPDLSGADGAFTVNRHFIQPSVSYAWNRRKAVSLSLGYGESDYDFAPGATIEGLEPWGRGTPAEYVDMGDS